MVIWGFMVGWDRNKQSVWGENCNLIFYIKTMKTISFITFIVFFPFFHCLSFPFPLLSKEWYMQLSHFQTRMWWTTSPRQYSNNWWKSPAFCIDQLTVHILPSGNRSIDSIQFFRGQLYGHGHLTEWVNQPGFFPFISIFSFTPPTYWQPRQTIKT